MADVFGSVTYVPSNMGDCSKTVDFSPEVGINMADGAKPLEFRDAPGLDKATRAWNGMEQHQRTQNWVDEHQHGPFFFLGGGTREGLD